MDNFSQLLLYIPGIIIFLVGSGQTRTGPGSGAWDREEPCRARS